MALEGLRGVGRALGPPHLNLNFQNPNPKQKKLTTTGEGLGEVGLFGPPHHPKASKTKHNKEIQAHTKENKERQVRPPKPSTPKIETFPQR